MGLRSALAFTAVALLWGSAAGAQSKEAEVIRLDYSAPAVCPSSNEFVRQILGRSQRIRLADDSEPALVLSVVLTGEQGDLLGRMALRDGDGAETVRSVRGDDCAEVIGALALIGALLLDPEASAEPVPSGFPEPPAEPQSAPPPAAEGEESLPLASPVPAPAPHRPLSSPAAERSAPLIAGFGVGGGLRYAIAPEAAFAMFVAVELSLDTRQLWQPLFSFGVHYADVGPFAVPATGQATFALVAARFAACPLRLPARGPLAARPCAFAELGSLSAAGGNTLDPQTHSLWWAAAGALARVEFVPHSSVITSVDAGIIAPLSRDTFYFAPDRVVHEVPPAAPVLELTVVVRP
jgi:hypothetical protein